MDIPTSKRFKTDSPFLFNERSLPKSIRTCLTLISKNFNSARSRNLDLMNTSDQRLFALMSHYDSNNFCWIHPTRSRSMATVFEYESYIQRINRYAEKDKIINPEEPQAGDDCIARYDSDGRWYRAVIVDKEDDEWNVFFVDYGNFQRCSIGQIGIPIEDRDCDHYFAPIQAVCCRLYNILPRVPHLRSEVDARLREFYSNNTSNFLEVKVKNVRSDFITDCDLFSPDESKKDDSRLYRRHIGQNLVDENLATFADPVAAYSFKIKEGK